MNLLTHMRTRTTASDHALLGCIGSLLGAAVTMHGPLWLILLGLIIGGFIIGAAVEAIQIIQRRGGAQNTRKEMLFDVLMTGFWPVTWWVKDD